MATLRFAPICVLFALLTSQSLFLPGQANAYNCCSCSNPYGNNCAWRGSTLHCPVCREGSPDLFQLHVAPIIPASDFTSSSEIPAVTLPASDLSDGMDAVVRVDNRRIGNPSSRLLPNAEFRIKAWCPGSL